MEEANDVGLGAPLDEVLVLPGLWVVHFVLGLFLAQDVQVADVPDDDLGLVVLVAVDDAEEVVALGFLVEDRGVVQVVLQDGDAFVVASVYLAQQRDFISFLLQDLGAMGAHVSQAFILISPCESSRLQEIVRVHKALELARHAEVSDKQGLLVYVLKQRILPILQRQAHPVLKVLMRSDNPHLLGSSLYLLVGHYSEIQGNIEGRPWKETLLCRFSSDAPEIHDYYGV